MKIKLCYKDFSIGEIEKKDNLYIYTSLKDI